jgi:hypothetical protein
MLALALSLAGALMVAAGARGQVSGIRDQGSVSGIRVPATNPKSKSKIQNGHIGYCAPGAGGLDQAGINRAVVAVTLFLLAHNRKLALRWLLIMVAIIVVPFAAFDLYTNGGFHQHTLSFRYYGTAVQHFVRNLRVLWTYETPLILCGVAFTALSLWAGFRRARACH